MKAMILAAGLGTRLQPYTQDIPKPLFPIAGRPLLDIAIISLIQAGCEAIIINTHHLHKQIKAFIAQQPYTVPVVTRYEPTILGTGGAIKNVADFWDSRPFMVVNGDIFSTIALPEVYAYHCAHKQPVTLVLYDEPAINTVAVDQNGVIFDFENQNDLAPSSFTTRLTFTGIQVLDPEILDYIPAQGYSSSIDAFKRMMADDKKIKSFIPQSAFWTDIGTPERFQQTVMKKILPVAFQRAYSDSPTQPVKQTKLKGDGSQRHWYRLSSGHYSLIMADHGIHTRNARAEIDAFVDIGRHLHAAGIPVPRIYQHDRFAGLVFLQDLGDIDLQTAVQGAPREQTIIAWYKAVIDILENLSILGAKGFDSSWTYQTPAYDKQLILDRECRYFIEAFLNAYLGWKISFDAYQDEFIALASKALESPVIGFIHRDLQSRNIMLNENELYLIDFQGGRLGPIQYDLASLLIDPYVELPERIQSRLLDYCIEKLTRRISVDAHKFRHCFRYCCLTRNLQILGAFGYLSKKMGKTYFERYLPAALRSLNKNLAGDTGAQFPKLRQLAQKVSADRQIRNIHLKLGASPHKR